MKRHWGFLSLTLLLAVILVSGCGGKTVLREEAVTQKPTVSAATKPAVPAPAKNTLQGDEEARKRAERERKEREAAAKAQAQETAVMKEKAAAAAPAKELYELADINFDFDKFDLKDQARASLDKHAEWLNKHKDVRIVIEGNCDERGTEEYNLALGERRANAAAKYLLDLGIDGKRIKSISYGMERPLDPRHNEEAWAKNRRDHFDVTGTK